MFIEYATRDQQCIISTKITKRNWSPHILTFSKTYQNSLPQLKPSTPKKKAMDSRQHLHDCQERDSKIWGATKRWQNFVKTTHIWKANRTKPRRIQQYQSRKKTGIEKWQAKWTRTWKANIEKNFERKENPKQGNIKNAHDETELKKLVDRLVEIQKNYRTGKRMKESNESFQGAKWHGTIKNLKGAKAVCEKLQNWMGRKVVTRIRQSCPRRIVLLSWQVDSVRMLMPLGLPELKYGETIQRLPTIQQATMTKRNSKKYPITEGSQSIFVVLH